MQTRRPAMREPLGVILAGGRGTRMGGIAKAGIRLGGERLLDRCIARLDPQVDGIIVNTNTPLETSLPCIADPIGGHLGPLAGVLAGMAHAAKTGHSHIVTVAVDTPFFPCDLVPQLLLAGTHHPDGFAMAATADGLQGTFGLWPVTLRDLLEAHLKTGGRKVRDFAEANGAATALFPTTTPDSFFNINTEQDLETAKTWV